jgi:hypothetical protein
MTANLKKIGKYDPVNKNVDNVAYGKRNNNVAYGKRNNKASIWG